MEISPLAWGDHGNHLPASVESGDERPALVDVTAAFRNGAAGAAEAAQTHFFPVFLHERI